MKIALTSTGTELTAAIDSRFGRCDYFIIIDTDSMQFEVLPNEHKDLSSGAGIQAATFMASKGVQAVITGNCGPNAIQVLSTAGIDIYTGEAGKTVKESIEGFKSGQLAPSKETGPSKPTVKDQGVATGRNPGQFIPQGGRGMGGGGRGMGGGGGRGMGGCGGGRGMGGGGRGMGGCGGGRGMGGGGREK
jgi:predicted Fe-Mo cluster-binding NifX family protein